MTRRGKRNSAKRNASTSGRMSEVVPGVWVGNRSAAGDRAALDAAGIKGIISIGGGPVQQPDLIFFKYGIKDNTRDASIPGLMVDASMRIAAIRSESGGAVLVHCMAGMSRSPAFVVAFCVLVLVMSKEQAFSVMREARPIVRIQRPLLEALDTVCAREKLFTDSQSLQNHHVDEIQDKVHECNSPDRKVKDSS